MISSTTLILATLVFNAASIFGAPIRIPSTAPEVEVRAPVPQPAIPVAVVDAQPFYKRSPSGHANRPRLAREDYETRATASESVEMRDSLPEVEEIVRRYPRRHLAEFYEKRSPEPAPAPDTPSAPSPQAEARSEPAPPVERRYPRRVLFDRHERRAAEPAPPVQARNEYDPDGHFVRAHNPELMAKRAAIPTDNFPREPEPAPAPIPEPAPAPAPTEKSEPVRRYPRRVYAEYYEKRQDTQDQPAPATPPEPSSTTTSTSAPPAPSSTTPITPIPASLEKAIADALIRGSSNVGTEPAGTKNSYSDTTITIKITQQSNSDVKPGGTPTNPIPPSSPSAPPTASGSTSSSTPSGTPTGDPTAPPPESTGSTTTGDDASAQPEDKSKPPKATATGTSSSGTPDGGASAAQPDAVPRDLGNSDAAVEPITKRNLGLSGALWASWTRRNSQN